MLLLLLLLLLLELHCPLAENSGRLTWVRQSSRESSATHSCLCRQSGGFCVSKKWYGCQCLGFLTCAQMLMPTTVHGDCS